MKILASSLLTAVFCVAALTAAPRAQISHRIFTGEISDSACGLDHLLASNRKQCTLECVHMGAKLVLVNQARRKVYALSDQAKAMPYAGKTVKVAGSLKGYTIEVSSITAVSQPAPPVHRSPPAAPDAKPRAPSAELSP
ncbi:MAG: hypothetical protein ACRD2B_14420 [Terriglobia bacterium]